MEKGYLLGILARTKRLFDRSLFDSGQVRRVLQDGSREFLTLIACICADGTAINPAIIFASDSETLQSTWVEQINDYCTAFVGATTSGWSNNNIGLAWLTQVFDRATKSKAGRSYRLLIVDGHGSHLTMDFIDYCDRNKTLLAIFPPHATHTLQPLDVCVFKSLSAAYSAELAAFLSKSQGVLRVAKSDFLSLFWRSWNSTITPQIITKAFQCTGIWPQKPAVILRRFDQQSSTEDLSPTRTPGAPNRSTRSTINQWINSARRDSERDEVEELRKVIHSLDAENKVIRSQLDDLRDTLSVRRTRQNKGKKLPTEEGDRYHGGAIFLSPCSVQRKLKEERRIARAKAKDARMKEKAAQARTKATEQAARKAEKRLQKTLKKVEIGKENRPKSHNNKIRKKNKGG